MSAYTFVKEKNAFTIVIFSRDFISHYIFCSLFSDHQNYFGVDDSLGPVAVSIKREKLDERENNLGKSESGLYQYRVIFRTSEVRDFSSGQNY